MTYNYTRDILNGSYCIENPLRVDGNGDQIYLSKEIEIALPGKVFTIICNGASADIIFTEALLESEKTTLDIVVTNHQENN